MFPARFNVPTLAVGIFPDPLPCWQFMAVGRLELVVEDHTEAAARLGREGRDEVAWLGHGHAKN